MITPFTFKGRIGRAPYAAWSVAIFLSLDLVPLAAGNLADGNIGTYLIPSRALRSVSGPLQPIGAAYLLIVAWPLTALAFRRANDADVGGSIAAFAIAPILQILVIPFLCIAPPVSQREPSVGGPAASEPVPMMASAMLGLVAGIALTLVSVALGTLVFGSYGSTLFLLSPFLIGVICAYIANYRADIGAGQTAWTVVMAVLLGGLMLVAVALEGAICIIMAAPPGLGM